MLPLAILALAALITSIISAIIGMGGGILLLAVMLSFLSHADTIPTHGAVQLISNGTRLLAFLRHVHWPVVFRFWWGAAPGAVLGGLALYGLRHGQIESTEPFLKIIIGAYVLIMTFLPRRKKQDDKNDKLDDNTSGPRFSAFSFQGFGFLAGALGLTIGAIGPLIAPLFLHGGFVKEKLIATKAVCQASVHLLKIPVFVALGSEFVQYDRLALLIVVMGAMVIPGTLIGKRILTHVNEKTFVMLFKTAMLLAGAKVLCFDGLYRLLVSPGLAGG